MNNLGYEIYFYVQVLANITSQNILNFFCRSALKDAINSPPQAMSIDEAYANAVITDALETEDEETGNTNSKFYKLDRHYVCRSHDLALALCLLL